MFKLRITALLALATMACIPQLALGQNAKQLQKLLQKYPQADTNSDGKLSIKEALAFRAASKTPEKNKKKVIAPPPTHENVQYGEWNRNVLDIWLPKSDQPTPLIVFIHGGGFTGGNKEQVRTTKNVQMALDRGVAFAAIHYRFRHPENSEDPTEDGERTAIHNILRDSARAIQFMRSNAAAYNLSKKVACYGGSAGAGTSIWLAFHDDLADESSEDTVLRESSRISAAGMLNGQFTYDLEQWDQEFKDIGGKMIQSHVTAQGKDPNELYGGFMGLTMTEYKTELGQDRRKDVDMRGLISSDDPPVFILTSTQNKPVHDRGIYNHHPRHAELIDARCAEVGVESLCLLPKVRDADQKRLSQDPDMMMKFFFDKLGK